MTCPFSAMQRDAAALRAAKAADQDKKTSNGTINDGIGNTDTGSSAPHPGGGVKVTFALDVPVLDKNKRPAGPASFITLEEGPVVKTVTEDTGSEPSNYGSGEGSPRRRKPSNVSTTSSFGSDGDYSELVPERKVDLNGLIEGVGTLIIPADYFVRRAVKNLINMNDHRVMDSLRNERGELFSEEVLQRSYSDPNLRHQVIDDDKLLDMATAAAAKLGWDTETFLRKLGQEYFKLCLGEYGKALQVLGSNLMEFFSNLDGLHEQIKNSPRFQGQSPPSFRCDLEAQSPDQPSRVNLHYYSFRRRILAFVGGTVEAVASMLFSVAVDLQVSPNRDPSSPHQMFFIATRAEDHHPQQVCKLCSDRGTVSRDPAQSKLSVSTFCASFPFHVIFDRHMHVIQLGAALMKMVTAERVRAREGGGGIPMRSLFEVVQPSVKMSFSAFLSRLNACFVLRTKPMMARRTAG